MSLGQAAVGVLRCVCLDDKHSNCQSECHGHVCIFSHGVDGCCRGGRHSHVTQQRLGPVPLPHLAHKNRALGYSGDVDLRNSYHCNGALHRCHLSNLVQGRTRTHQEIR